MRRKQNSTFSCSRSFILSIGEVRRVLLKTMLLSWVPSRDSPILAARFPSLEVNYKASCLLSFITLHLLSCPLLCLYLLLPSLYFASIVVSAVVVVVAPFRCIVFVLSVPAAHAPVILTCLRPPFYGTALRRRPTTEFLSSFRFFVLLSGRDYLVDSLEVWWFSGVRTFSCFLSVSGHVKSTTRIDIVLLHVYDRTSAKSRLTCNFITSHIAGLWGPARPSTVARRHVLLK